MRALFSEDSPFPTATPSHGFRHMQTASWFSPRALKRLWQAVSLILLTTSFAASVYLLGRGNVTDDHRSLVPSLATSVQQHFGHLLRYDLPGPTYSATADKPTLFTDSEISLAFFRRARNNVKDHIASMWDAAKHRVFRFSVVFRYRFRSVKGYVSGLRDGFPNADSSVAADEEVQEHCGSEAVHKSENDHENMVDSDAHTASFDGTPKPTVEISDEQEQFYPFLVDGTCRCVSEFSEDESVESSEAFHRGSQDYLETEITSSTASMLHRLDLAVGQRALPSPDLDENVDTWQQVWTWQFKSVGKTIRDSSVSALKVGYTLVSNIAAAVSLEYHQMKAALTQLKNYVFVKTETFLLNPDWQRLHGIDHSLIVCAAMALLMSTVSMLVFVTGYWQGAQQVSHAAVHVDSDSVRFCSTAIMPSRSDPCRNAQLYHGTYRCIMSLYMCRMMSFCLQEWPQHSCMLGLAFCVRHTNVFIWF